MLGYLDVVALFIIVLDSKCCLTPQSYGLVGKGQTYQLHAFFPPGPPDSSSTGKCWTVLVRSRLRGRRGGRVLRESNACTTRRSKGMGSQGSITWITPSIVKPLHQSRTSASTSITATGACSSRLGHPPNIPCFPCFAGRETQVVVNKSSLQDWVAVSPNARLGPP